MNEGDARDLALQRAIADACLGRAAGEALAADLGGFLAAHGVHPDDAAAVLAAAPRLGVYRSLVRNGMGAVVLRMLPRTLAALDAAGAGRFARDMAAFAEERGPRTHYLRDVPSELVAWAAPRWAADPALPAHLVDLARFELAHFEIGAAEPARAEPRAAALSLDRGVALLPSARLLRLGAAVHEVEGAAEPAAREVALVGYRDAAHDVHWVELTPLAGDVVARLLEGEALGAAVSAACAARGAAPAGEIEAIARLLAELGARGVVLGARE